MAMTSALAFMLATSPGSCHVRPKWQTAERHPQVDQMLQQVRRHQQCVLQAPSVGDTGCWHLLTGLRATLSVCMEEDCLQQGAPQTLAKFRKNAAKRRDVTVETCSCVGMCGLGPCVTIDWGEAGFETYGGVDPSDDATIAKLVDDATKPLARESQGPEGAGKKSYDSDPYAEQ